jgi:hypothetical protein
VWLVEYYRELFGALVRGAEEKLQAGIITLEESVDIARKLNDIWEAIEAIEEFYTPMPEVAEPSNGF